MKTSALLFAMSAVIILFTTVNADSTTVTHFQTNGVTAFASACTDNCASEIVLTLLQSKAAGKNSYYVYFDIYGHDSNGNVTDINSAGLIPARMVSGNGHTNLTLELDTEAADLEVSDCVMGPSGIPTCAPYSGGVINISWTTTRQFSSSYSGQSQTKYTNFSAHANYHQEMSSATVTANVWGTQYSDSGSQLGNGHDGELIMTKP